MLAAALALTGCAGTDIEFEGKVFDMVGLNKKRNKGDKKLEPRAPLVLPPTTGKLPEPGVQHATTQPENWPADPDAQRKRELSVAKKKLKHYQEHGDFSSKSGMEEFRRIVNPNERLPGLVTKKASGIELMRGSIDEASASPDITENIKENVDFKKLPKTTGEATADAGGSGQTRNNSWAVSKDELEKLRKSDSPDITDGFIDKW